jgi:hypothetical protein
MYFEEVAQNDDKDLSSEDYNS